MTTEARLGQVANYVDERTGAAAWMKKNLQKVFPDHWSFLLGEVALYSFIILLLSGTFLTFWFDPSQREVIYEGAYAPLEGIIAFSKICSHMGCAVALYEQQTKHLLCPCHQSTFDVTRAAKVIFGPAARPLPQLDITVDGEGYLVARNPFSEPVGPSFWERDSR